MTPAVATRRRMADLLAADLSFQTPAQEASGPAADCTPCIPSPPVSRTGWPAISSMP